MCDMKSPDGSQIVQVLVFRLKMLIRHINQPGQNNFGKPKWITQLSLGIKQPTVWECEGFFLNFKICQICQINCDGKVYCNTKINKFLSSSTLPVHHN